MAKSENQKLKLLYIRKFLLEQTDKDHRVTTAQIIDELTKHEIKAERKSIYDDIECLRSFGMDIKRVQKDRTYSYYVANRPFELPELKLLVDSVQSAKFMLYPASYRSDVVHGNVITFPAIANSILDTSFVVNGMSA